MAEERKTNKELDELTKKLEEGVKEIFDSEKYKQWLETMSRFHRYSWRNTVLINMQCPEATRVAGYNAWREKFHRYVQRGAKSIKIIAPVTYKKTIPVPAVDENGVPLVDADGNAVMVEKKVESTYFKVENVFDVSDTKGDPLPEIAQELTGKADNYKNLFEALTRTSPAPISFDETLNIAKGLYSPAENKIVVRASMGEAQTLKTIIHEQTHARLHSGDNKAERGAGDDQKSKNTKETEAESVAYIVCNHFGIDTSDYSFGYIASWANSNDTKELYESLTTIQKTACETIEAVESELAVMEKERELTKERWVAATNTRQLDPAAFEKLLPNNMRFKKVNVVNKNEVYWVTQEIFNTEDLQVFQKAIREYKPDITTFYVVPRDLSSYNFTDDGERGVLALVTPESIQKDDYIEALHREGFEEPLRDNTKELTKETEAKETKESAEAKSVETKTEQKAKAEEKVDTKNTEQVSEKTKQTGQENPPKKESVLAKLAQKQKLVDVYKENKRKERLAVKDVKRSDREEAHTV